MTVIKLRHYCRNPHCRSKLSTPVVDQRQAFCCDSCHGSFYRSRCVICEQPMERHSPNQKAHQACRDTQQGIQGRPTPTENKLTHSAALSPDSGAKNPLESKPKNGGCETPSDRTAAFQSEIVDAHRWRESVSPDDVPIWVTKIKTGKQQPKVIEYGKTACMTCGKRYEYHRPVRHNPRFCCSACQERCDEGKPERRWHQVAGPMLTPDQLRGATVPDGPNGGWAGGEYERIEANNRAALEGYFGKQPTVVDVAFTPAVVVSNPAPAIPDSRYVISDDLSIPEFLRRDRWQAQNGPDKLAA